MTWATDATVATVAPATVVAPAPTTGRKAAKVKPAKVIVASNKTPSVTKVNVSLINTDYSLNKDIQQDNLPIHSESQN